MSRRGFICAGCWTLDRIKVIDKWPGEEELANIVGLDQQGGGSAHNVAIDLKKLAPELPVSTIGLLGSDADGDFLFNRTSQYSIKATQLKRTTKAATSYTDVMSVESSGKRTFFHHSGANDLLAPEHFNFAKSSEQILHLGLLGLHERMDASHADGENGWSLVLAEARAQGLKTSIEMVSINPLRNRALVLPCLAHLDYLVVNDHEIGSIAGRDTLTSGTTDIPACLSAARDVLQKGAMQTVTVHYPNGALCVSRGGEEFLSDSLQLPESNIKSSVGAGDAFVAGFLYAMHESFSIPEALELAHSVAAISLQSMTTTGAIQNVEQCLNFARQMRLDKV